MNAHDWLCRVTDLDGLITAKLEERDQLMALATKCTGDMDGMPRGSGTSDKVGNAAVKLADMAKEIDDLVDEYVDLKREVNAALDKLDACDQVILRRLYLQGMSQVKVAELMGVCTMTVWRQKVKALKNLEDVMACCG
jgi:RNA polymerase sigma factor (sigma-70 family)